MKTRITMKQVRLSPPKKPPPSLMKATMFRYLRLNQRLIADGRRLDGAAQTQNAPETVARKTAPFLAVSAAKAKQRAEDKAFGFLGVSRYSQLTKKHATPSGYKGGRIPLVDQKRRFLRMDTITVTSGLGWAEAAYNDVDNTRQIAEGLQGGNPRTRIYRHFFGLEAGLVRLVFEEKILPWYKREVLRAFGVKSLPNTTSAAG